MSVRIFKTKWLSRFARREKISGASLREAIERAERGLLDADLGGGLIKQRVAKRGAGRSGGYRMIIAYREGDRAVFLYGFAKSELDNIPPASLDTFRTVARGLLSMSVKGLEEEMTEGRLEEVSSNDDEEEA